MLAIDQRPSRGLAILALGNQIKRLDPSTYKVKSQSNGGSYLVVKNGEGWSCECPDHKYRTVTCKHIHSVLFSLTLRNSIITSQDVIPRIDESTPDECSCCHSDRIVKRGVRKNKRGLTQIFWCKSCNKRFVVDLGFSRMKASPQAITAALDLYFKGISLRSITDHLKQFYGLKVNCSTVLRWIHRYIKLMSEYVKELMPQVSDKWHADETTINVNGHYRWLWNLMDSETRFLLSSKLTQTRREHEATNLFLEGRLRSDRAPNLVVTDGLLSYEGAFRNAFPKGTRHLCSPRFIDRTNNNLVERLHGTVKDRTKVMRGLDQDLPTNKIVEGFNVYYNFIRPHKALNGKTPAQVAKLDMGLEGNRWRSLIAKSADEVSRRKDAKKSISLREYRMRAIKGTVRTYLKGERNGVTLKWLKKQVEYLKKNGLTKTELKKTLKELQAPESLESFLT